MRQKVERLMKRRDAAINRWIRKCARMVGLEDSIWKEVETIADFDRLMKEKKLEIEYLYKGISKTDNKETHQLIINGKQVGSTLIIEHEFKGIKMVLTVKEKPQSLEDE